MTNFEPVAILPVKDLVDAKQRLAPALDAPARRALFEAMLEDVLEALAGCERLAGICVVTRDPHAERLAARYAARVLREQQNQGQTEAVSLAARTLAGEGISAMLAVPADIPTVNARELETLIAAHTGGRAVTIGPARDKLGSNAMLVSPPDVMPFRFGDNSFYPHVERARSLGIEPTIIEQPGIGLDVDTPEDLVELARRPLQSRAQRVLATLEVRWPAPR